MSLLKTSEDSKPLVLKKASDFSTAHKNFDGYVNENIYDQNRNLSDKYSRSCQKTLTFPPENSSKEFDCKAQATRETNCGTVLKFLCTFRSLKVENTLQAARMRECSARITSASKAWVRRSTTSCWARRGSKRASRGTSRWKCWTARVPERSSFAGARRSRTASRCRCECRRRRRKSRITWFWERRRDSKSRCLLVHTSDEWRRSVSANFSRFRRASRRSSPRWKRWSPITRSCRSYYQWRCRCRGRRTSIHT